MDLKAVDIESLLQKLELMKFKKDATWLPLESTEEQMFVYVHRQFLFELTNWFQEQGY